MSEVAPEFIVGQDALDIAMMTGLQLHRGETRHNSTPDTAWVTAQALIVAGGATALDFYIDPYALTNVQAGDTIHHLIGLFKAWGLGTEAT